jgi:hypothetical protein
MRSLFAMIVVISCSCLLLYGQQPVRIVHSFAVRSIDGQSKQVLLGTSRATVVVFVSALCPVSMAYGERLAKLNADLSSRGVLTILVNSNQNESDALVEEQRRTARLPMPVYRDPDARLAELLGVYGTPAAVVLDGSGTIRYVGSIDDARDPRRVTRQYLREAIEAILAGQPVAQAQTRTFGCSIKRSSAP